MYSHTEYTLVKRKRRKEKERNNTCRDKNLS